MKTTDVASKFLKMLDGSEGKNQKGVSQWISARKETDRRVVCI